MADIIDVTIEDDGTVTVETDKISASNHLGADKLLSFFAKLLGGKRDIKHKQGHIHTHRHQGITHTH